jgi:hypothetical protein
MNYENEFDLDEPINNNLTLCSNNMTLMESMNDLTLKMNEIEEEEEHQQ